ncbi:MAG TPA: hypothetical protein VIC28_16575, partial [Thermoanaerobaculia bacterium]
MNDETRDERLRRMLCEADAADGETGLTLEEIRTMRRTVLTAIPEPRRRFAMSPVPAGAAMAVLVAILALALWRQRDQPPVPSYEPVRAAAPASAVPPAPVEPPSAERIASESAPVAKASPPRRIRRHRTVPEPSHERIAENEQE